MAKFPDDLPLPEPPADDDDNVGRRRHRRKRGGGKEPEQAAAQNAAVQAMPWANRTWQPLGPTATIRTEWGRRQRIAGRVRDLAVSPDGERLYAASGAGGVWASTDRGLHWFPLSGWYAPSAHMGQPDGRLRHDITTSASGALYVEFGTTPADDVVYWATGEAVPHASFPSASEHPGHGHGGSGIHRAEGPIDKVLADPWAAVWESEAPNLSGLGIFRLARHPSGYWEMVAATSNGLWSRSGDFEAGQAWTRSTALDAKLTELGFAAGDWHVSDVVWAPTMPDHRSDVVVEAARAALDAYVDAWVAHRNDPSRPAPDVERQEMLAADLEFQEAATTELPARLWVGIAATPGLVLYSDNGPAGPFEEVRVSGLGNDRSHRVCLALGRDSAELFALDARSAPNDGSKVAGDIGRDSELIRIRVDFGLDAYGQLMQSRPVHIKASGSRAALSYAEIDPVVTDDGYRQTTPTLFIGGTTVEELKPKPSKNSHWDTSLFRCSVVKVGDQYDLGFDPSNWDTPQQDSTYIGRGVHADIHRVVTRPYTADELDDGRRGTHEVWVTCDGGIYRSPRDGDPNSFVSRNDGLVNLEVGFLDAVDGQPHPVVVGTQDNGIATRVGHGVWRVRRGGDGGGVFFDPHRSGEFFGQYIRGTWWAWGSGGASRRTWQWASPLDWKRRSGSNTDRDAEVGEPAKAEAKAGQFYSRGDVIASTTAGRSNIALGIERVWVGEDWNGAGQVNRWKVLPEYLDPYSEANGAAAKALGTNPSLAGNVDPGNPGSTGVISCRWIDHDRLLVLSETALVLYTRPAAAGDPGPDWRHASYEGQSALGVALTGPQVSLQGMPTMRGNPTVYAYPTELAPRQGAGPPSAYVAMAVRLGGQSAQRALQAWEVEPMWWCDMAPVPTWHPMGLAGAVGGGAIDALALVVDPDDPNVLYVGTDMGVWKAVASGLDEAPPNPSWVWTPFSDGLPLGRVEDLAVTRFGSRRFLRAGLPAHGVWEVDLDDDVVQTVFVRAHWRDTRHVLPASDELAFAKDDEAGGGDDRSAHRGSRRYWWASSPDIGIHRTPFDASSAAGSKAYPLSSDSKIKPGDYEMWLFQTGLHSLEPSFVPSHAATDQYLSALTAFRSGARAGDVVLEDWEAVLAAGGRFGVPWLGAEPNEVDLFELADQLEHGGIPDHRAGVPTTIQVMMHHRGAKPVRAGAVQVLLLHRELPRRGRRPVGDHLDRFAAGSDGLVSASMRDALRAQFGDTAGAPVASIDGWQVVGRRALGRDLDVRIPQTVAFDHELVAGKGSIYLAIVSDHPVDEAPDTVVPPTLTGSTIKELVLRSSGVASKIAWGSRTAKL